MWINLYLVDNAIASLNTADSRQLEPLREIEKSSTYYKSGIKKISRKNYTEMI